MPYREIAAYRTAHAAGSRCFITCDPSSGGMGIRLKAMRSRLSQMPYPNIICRIAIGVPGGGEHAPDEAHDHDRQRAREREHEIRRHAGERDDDVAAPEVPVIPRIHRHRLGPAEDHLAVRRDPEHRRQEDRHERIDVLDRIPRQTPQLAVRWGPPGAGPRSRARTRARSPKTAEPARRTGCSAVYSTAGVRGAGRGAGAAAGNAGKLAGLPKRVKVVWRHNIRLLRVGLTTPRGTPSFPRSRNCANRLENFGELRAKNRIREEEHAEVPGCHGAQSCPARRAQDCPEEGQGPRGHTDRQGRRRASDRSGGSKGPAPPQRRRSPQEPDRA